MADSSALPQPPQVTEAMIDAALKILRGDLLGPFADEAWARELVRESLEAALGAPETPPPQWDFEEPTEAETPMMALGELLAHTYAEDGSRKSVNPDAVEYWVKAARLAPSSPPPPATPSEETPTVSGYKRQVDALRRLVIAMQWVQPTYNGSSFCAGCGEQKHHGCPEECPTAAVTGDRGGR